MPSLPKARAQGAATTAVATSAPGLTFIPGTTGSTAAGVEVINNRYSLGTTDANGDLVIEGFPMGLYLLNLNEDGYKMSNAGMVVYSNKVHTFALTPA